MSTDDQRETHQDLVLVRNEHFHFRDEEPRALYEQGIFTGYSVIQRRLLKTREQTYAYAYRLTVEEGSTTVQCLLPFCTLKTRMYKIAFNASGKLIFANVLKHLAHYHPAELCNEDRHAALSLIPATAAAKASVGNNSVVQLLMATVEQRTAQAQSKNKALVARVRLAWCEMIVHGGLVFNIAANEGIRAGFNKLLQVDEAYPLKYPSVRTVVRDVDRTLDEEEAEESRGLDVFLLGDPHSPYWFRNLCMTEDAWTRAGNMSVSVYTLHFVRLGRLEEGVMEAVAEEIPDHT